MDKVYKVFDSVIKEFDDKEMTLTATISTGAVDRQKEVLQPDGVDLRHYRKNPVVLWAHDYSMPPIGKAQWAKQQDGGIISKVKFLTTDGKIGEFAKEIYQLYKEKFLNAFSVGFIPKETKYATDEERADAKKPRLTYTKWEMIEFSAVPVPANPEALQMAYSKGLIKCPLWKSVIEKENDKPVLEFNNEEVVTLSSTPENALVINYNGLDELLSENKNLIEKITGLEKENGDLRLQLFNHLYQKQKDLSEITANDFEDKIIKIVDGVIRKAQGKVN